MKQNGTPTQKFFAHYPRYRPEDEKRPTRRRTMIDYIVDRHYALFKSAHVSPFGRYRIIDQNWPYTKGNAEASLRDKYNRGRNFWREYDLPYQMFDVDRNGNWFLTEICIQRRFGH